VHCVTDRRTVAVHLVGDVADCFLAYLEVGRFAADVRGVHERAEVNAGATVEEAPDLTRHVRQHRLSDQYQRHPLVVADALRVGRWLEGYRRR